MKQVTGIDFKVEIGGKRAGDPAALIADNSKLTIRNLKSFGWTPKYEDLNLICQSAYEWEMVDG
ncbi:MAG: hypothetical protein GXP61_00380, partial [Epsilonproteobacteria bacterium]|nr:hypothetical protein [Campylobacterota bacterium]